MARHVCSVISAVGAEDEAVFVSNSMPIRYLDMLCPVAPTVLCNRGASGIDGILHTAIGATGAGSRCTLSSVTFTLHDLNGLSTLSNSNLPLVIVMLNNAGGGIFRFLPSRAMKTCTAHTSIPAQASCKVLRRFRIAIRAQPIPLISRPPLNVREDLLDRTSSKFRPNGSWPYGCSLPEECDT